MDQKNRGVSGAGTRPGSVAPSLLLALACCFGPGCGDDDDGNGAQDAGTDGGGDAGGTLALDLHLPPSGSLLSYAGGLTLLPVELRAPEGFAVDLGVTVDPGMAAEVEPTRLVGSGVVEVFLRPAASSVDRTLSFEVRAAAGALETRAGGALEVIGWMDDGSEHADGLLAIFLPYIAEHHPELGLGPDTEWIESWNSMPVLIVTHRSYLSQRWEVHVAWHNTVAPHDWAWVTARRRDQLAPEIGFCIPSQAEDHAIREADLSDPRLPCAR